MLSILFFQYSIPPLKDELLSALSITTVVKVPTMVCNIAENTIDNTMNTLPAEGHLELFSWSSVTFALFTLFPLVFSASSSDSSHNAAVLGKRRAALISSMTATTFHWIITYYLSMIFHLLMY